jgi:hypothetical protein
MTTRAAIALASLALFVLPAAGRASDCMVTSVGFTPLNDLGAGLYLGQFQGGLYPGSNDVPAAHAAVGRARALTVKQVNPHVLLSIGMSNTTQEFCSQPGTLPCDAWTFMGQAAANVRTNNTSLRIANGARGGQAISTWDQPTDANYDRVRDEVLAPQGLSETDVQVLWIKQAIPQPMVGLPNANADAYQVEAGVANLLRAAKARYPNCQIALLSSRIYAGYAGYPIPTASTLNPEPYAYESGFGIKWLIEAQINQMAGGGIDPQAGNLDYNSAVPWIAWGPYLWADGTTPRSDGLTYLCSDLQNDGTHPAMGGEQKVGAMLLSFMLNSPFAAPWFRDCELGDMNMDGTLNGADIGLFTQTIVDPASATDMQRCAADCNDDLSLGGADAGAFVIRLLGWEF